MSVSMSRFEEGQVPLMKVLEPRCAFNEGKSYDFLSGVRQIQYKNIEATSASTSNLTFTYKPPSNVLISRKMWIKYNLTLVFTGTNSLGGNLLNIGRSDALRAFPLQTCSSSVKIKINGEQFSSDSPDQYLQAVLRYQAWGKDALTDLSNCPSMLDQSQSYDDVTTLGFARNPLANVLENSFQVPRGCTQQYTVVSNTPTSAVVRVECMEPLMVSPLVWGDRQSPAFASIQDLQVQLTLDNALKRVWSHASIDGTTLTNIDVNISTSGANPALSQPYLVFQEITPNPDNAVVLGKSYLYPYSQVNVQVSDTFSAVTAGSSAQNSIPNIQYGNVPKSLVIFVKERLSDQQNTSAPYQSWTSTDTFARINSLSISINGQSSILAEASTHDLYQICAKNGLKDSWPQFRNNTGSVLCLEMGSDIPLDFDQAPGLVTNFNVQINNLNITNISGRTMNYQVVVLAVFDGIAQIKDNQMILSQGLLSKEEILRAPYSSMVHRPSAYGLTGGSFWDKFVSGFKSVASNVLPVAKALAPVAKMVIPGAQPILGAVGLGRRRQARRGMGVVSRHELSGYGFKDESRGVGYLDKADFKKKLAQSDYEDNDENGSAEEYDY